MRPGGGEGRGLAPFCTSAAGARREPDHQIREKQLSSSRKKKKIVIIKKKEFEIFSLQPG